MTGRAELWTPRTGVEIRRGRSNRNTPAPPVVSNFAGDPGDGKFNIGWALGPGNLTVTAVRANPGYPGDAALSVLHDYSDNLDGVKVTKLDNAINNGWIPSQSFKMQNWTQAQIIAGSADSQIATSAAACIARAPWPIWLCYYHEPEDNFAAGAAATNYRLAFRHIVERFRVHGVTNVAWMPIFQNPWTFFSTAGPSPTTASGGSGRDWRNWHPDWNGTGWNDDIMMDAFGADTYNPLPGSTTNQTSYAYMWDVLRQQVERPGYPVWDYVQPEFGLGSQASPQPNWSTWTAAAITYSKANRIKNFTYWDNDPDTHWWTLGSTTDPGNLRKAAWDQVVAASIKKVTA